jgi:N-acetylneuraminate synthase
MPEKQIEINGVKIGLNHKPYIIAELSANHNGDINRAFKTIKMAKEMGADAIKIQTYTADTMTIDCDNDYFKIVGGLWNGYKLHELYKWAETPYEWHKQIFDYAKQLNITIFSTPFDETAIDLLESLNCPAYKIASFEATDLPLISRAAKTGKPLIISTGMANESEINDIVDTVKKAGGKDLALLHCISSYPAPVDQSNLKTIPDITEKWNVIAGLSDHTLGTSVAITSVALGACIIEKHVTLDRSDKGPDCEFSLEPNELKQLITDTKNAWLSLGHAGYECKKAEKENLKFRRSIFFVKDIKQGDVITKENTRRIRPGYGLPPKFYNDIIGKTVSEDIKRGTPTSWALINNNTSKNNE